MGADKALVEFRGRPLVAHALGILRGAGLDASIAGARAALGEFAPVVEDAEAGLGPLGGICAALGSSTARWVVVVSVDLPLLPAALVEFLLHHARITERAVTVASVAGFAQTFPVVLARAVLPWLRSELDAGRGGCFSAFQTAAASLGQPVSVVAAELAAQAGQAAHPDGLPVARWFFNVNTAADLCRAEAQAARVGYSRIRVDVPDGTAAEWRFHQEKATLQDLALGTVTRILL
jgi:molybdopterin-guanine dinucleotide biosynthesis protein A